MNIDRLTRSLALLGRAFRQDVDELFIEAYLIGIDQLTDDEVEHAARMAIKSCRFMPSPVELAAFVGREPVESLMRPASKCRACQLALDFAESQARGYCAKCWRGVLSQREPKRIKSTEQTAIEGER